MDLSWPLASSEPIQSQIAAFLLESKFYPLEAHLSGELTWLRQANTMHSLENNEETCLPMLCARTNGKLPHLGKAFVALCHCKGAIFGQHCLERLLANQTQKAKPFLLSGGEFGSLQGLANNIASSETNS